MSMFTGRDEARSDLFLAGAFYVFGPLLVSVLLFVVPLQRIPGVGRALALTLPLVFTVLVPVLLIRYRRERLADYGLQGGTDPSVGIGLLAGLPIVAAGLVAGFVATGDLVTAVPVVAAAHGGLFTVVVRLLEWCGVLLLALYGTVKARDAFGGEPVRMEEAVVRVGRVVGIAVLVATALLLLAMLRQFDVVEAVALVLQPLGVFGAVWFAWQRLGKAGSTTLPTVITPVVLLAIGPFALTFQARQLVTGIYNAALYAGVGLVVALIMEGTRRGLGVVVLAVVIALLTRLGLHGLF